MGHRFRPSPRTRSVPHGREAPHASISQLRDLTSSPASPIHPEGPAFSSQTQLRCAPARPPTHDRLRRIGRNSETVAKCGAPPSRLACLPNDSRSRRRALFPLKTGTTGPGVATTKPAEDGRPCRNVAGRKNLETHLLNDAHFAAHAPPAHPEILAEAELKPHKVRSWRHRDDESRRRRGKLGGCTAGAGAFSGRGR